MTEFGFTHTVDVRYQDYDMLGHVNNAVYLTYLEDARSAYFAERLGLSFGDIDMVVAHLEVDFRAPVKDADEVDVAIAVTDVGDTSFTMGYEVRDGDTVALEGESVQVTVDPETGESRPIPEAWRDAFGSPTA
ncbi:acyl-CoA thioesterase [Halobacterium bonnevillei]|uniref:Acyl-CoA thioesterase n=1 Tax=Halobacterium bonnevillei TaxID=2692200 RepID=A0A6B0SCL5_9EURY|nr:thioesterase family protein [Halobacterium bonnevillei]MXR19485.1 acyl-CoA thioesterase [Halobacterium bonnevillei]